MTTDILISTPEHCAFVVNHVRPEDKEEIWAQGLTTPERALRHGLLYSDKMLTGLVDGKPVCIWGVVSEGFIGNVGIPWMIGTTLLDRYAFTFLRRCRKPLLELMAGYDRLENYVDARNKRTIQWLKFMGFHVEGEAHPHGALKMPFHRFWMEASHV